MTPQIHAAVSRRELEFAVHSNSGKYECWLHKARPPMSVIADPQPVIIGPKAGTSEEAAWKAIQAFDAENKTNFDDIPEDFVTVATPSAAPVVDATAAIAAAKQAPKK
jgi:hypothetical protein